VMTAACCTLAARCVQKRGCHSVEGHPKSLTHPLSPTTFFQTTPTDTAALDAAASSRDRALRDGLVVAGARHEAHRYESDDTSAAPATMVYGRAAPPPQGAAMWRAPGVGGAVCVWGPPGVSARVVPALRSFAVAGFGLG
jgi:hypothetical protein